MGFKTVRRGFSAKNKSAWGGGGKRGGGEYIVKRERIGRFRIQRGSCTAGEGGTD
jgi:hypothetical protein